MQELWELLVSAQDTIGGIPTKFLEQKKEEIRQKKVKSEAIDLRREERREERECKEGRERRREVI